MSLRIRLIVIVTSLFIVSSSIGAGYSIWIAKAKVSDEVQSASTLITELFKAAGNATGASEQEIASNLERTLANHNDLRHINIQVHSDEKTATFGNNFIKSSVPIWFTALVQPEPETLIFSVALTNGGVLRIQTSPIDEIEEVWEETQLALLLSFSIATLFALVLYFLLGRWLQPIERIVAVLHAVEHGDYNQRLPNPTLPELKQIAKQFNHLTEGLAHSKAENNQLRQKALEIQEQERRLLAQELHDEMGQSVSAIKAIAASLEHTRSNDKPKANSHLKDIQQIADKMYGSVRGMMNRLRPALLDELGLIAALQQMSDDWNDHHTDTFCSFIFKGVDTNENFPFNEQQQIHVYRIIQEALTNVAKHARAETVKITLEVSTDRNECLLFITDNGAGFNLQHLQRNMGLTGIQERATALQGNLTIDSSPGQGVIINIAFPINSQVKN